MDSDATMNVFGADQQGTQCPLQLWAYKAPHVAGRVGSMCRPATAGHLSVVADWRELRLDPRLALIGVEHGCDIHVSFQHTLSWIKVLMPEEGSKAIFHV